MRLLIVLLWFFSTAICASDKPSRSLLIGGGFKICSSYSTKHCSVAKSFNGDAFIGNRYKVTPDLIAILQEDRFETFKAQSRKVELVELLEKFLIRNKSEVETKTTLLRKLDDLSLSSSSKSGREVLDSLSPFEENFFMQTMQLPALTPEGKQLTEYVLLEQSHADSVAIVNRFIGMVKEVSDKERPLILFSTASANDVFDAVSFYYQLFKSKDVDVAWLPIEASMNRVVESDSLTCNDLETVRAQQYGIFAREKVYPQSAKYQMKFCQNPALINRLVSEAEGIFFNGGDQSLTLASLALIKNGRKSFSDTYKIISKRHSEGKLVISGTSAGTAVQSGGVIQGKKIPMVTNGESEYGFINGSVATNRSPSSQCVYENNCDKNVDLKTLTRFESGGFELMPFGIFDTHFSERDRLFRLIRLLEDSSIQLGIGVDENTALEMSSLGGEVFLRGHGEGATWITQKIKAFDDSYKLYAIWNKEEAILNLKSNKDEVVVRGKSVVSNQFEELHKRLEQRVDKVSKVLKQIIDRRPTNPTGVIKLQSRSVTFELENKDDRELIFKMKVR